MNNPDSTENNSSQNTQNINRGVTKKNFSKTNKTWSATVKNTVHHGPPWTWSAFTLFGLYGFQGGAIPPHDYATATGYQIIFNRFNFMLEIKSFCLKISWDLHFLTELRFSAQKFPAQIFSKYKINSKVGLISTVLRINFKNIKNNFLPFKP